MLKLHAAAFLTLLSITAETEGLLYSSSAAGSIPNIVNSSRSITLLDQYKSSNFGHRQLYPPTNNNCQTTELTSAGLTGHPLNLLLYMTH